MTDQRVANYQIYTNDCLLVDSMYIQTLYELERENRRILSKDISLPSLDDISKMENHLNNLLRRQNIKESTKFQQTMEFIQKYTNI